jgi:DNA invertase Pin-like site-specific DNA recombinase
MATVLRPTVQQRAAIYCRVSTKKQEDNFSLPDQEARCRAWCGEHGYSVEDRHIYQDVYDGDDYYGRPAFTAMRQAMMRGEFDALVFLERDRVVTRGGPKHLYTLQTEAQEYDVQLVCVLEPLPDPEDEDAELVEYIEARQARREKQRLREKTQRMRHARAQSGKLIPGCVPLYGYRWGDPDAKHGKSYYVLDEETWPIVRRIRQEGLTGVPIRQIAQRLTDEHIPTPSHVLWVRGRLPRNRTPTDTWAPAMVAKILSHPAYAGSMAAYRNQMVTRKERVPYTGERRRVRTMRLRPADDPLVVPLGPTVCPPVDGPEVAAALAARLARNAAESSRHARYPEGALLRNGYAICGYCNGRMSGQRVAHRAGDVDREVRVYRCTRQSNKRNCIGQTMSVRKLDTLVWNAVEQWISDETRFQSLLAQWRERGHQTEDQHLANLKANEGALAKLRTQAQNLAASIASTDDPDTRALLTRLLDDLMAEQRKALAEQEDLRTAAADHAAHMADVEGVASWLAAAKHRLATFTYQQKRATLFAFGVHVHVWRHDHDPQYLIRFDWDGLKTGMSAEVVAHTCVDQEETAESGRTSIWTTSHREAESLPAQAPSRAILSMSSGSCSPSTS